ncbi:MAG: hypothetical protein ACRD7E_18915 [Bryobacteraceae bacterium]
MFRFMCLLLGAIVPVFCAPVDCLTGTLADYLTLPADGCSLGPVTVSDFANPGVLPTSTEIAPSTINVTPIFDASPGLRFEYGASAGPGEVFQSIVEFVLSFPSSAASFGELRGEMAALSGGAASATSEFCSGTFAGGLCTGSSQVLAVFHIGDATDDFDRQSLPPGAIFAIRHDVVADGGLDASASVDAAELRFSQVPEPATAATVLTALAAFLVCRRCRTRRRI